MGYRVVTVKRRLAKLAMFLILGAIVNVAVAWGCALFSQVAEVSGMTDLSNPARWWPAYLSDADWPPPRRALRWNGTGFGVTVVDVLSEARGSRSKDWYLDEGTEFGSIYLYRFGWPLRSLQWVQHGTGGPRALALVRDAEARAGWRKGIAVPDIIPARGERLTRRIPITPVATGFIVNAFLYGTVLWLLTLGPFNARRVIRRKRGLCIKCGYDLRGHSAGGGEAVCPECGATTR